jgi:hypothetical protein
LGGELLIPLGLLQDALDVALYPLAKARGDATTVVSCRSIISELRWEVHRQQDRIGREGDGLLDDVL